MRLLWIKLWLKYHWYHWHRRPLLDEKWYHHHNRIQKLSEERFQIKLQKAMKDEVSNDDQCWHPSPSIHQP